jgi:hypothetical protein
VGGWAVGGCAEVMTSNFRLEPSFERELRQLSAGGELPRFAREVSITAADSLQPPERNVSGY